MVIDVAVFRIWRSVASPFYGAGGNILRELCRLVHYLLFFCLFQVLPYALADILGRCVRCRAEIRGENKGKVKIRRESKT